MSDSTEQLAPDRSATVHRRFSRGLHEIVLHRGSWRELFLTALPVANEGPEPMLERLAAVVERHDARILSQTLFHIAEHRQAALDTIQQRLGPIRWPITWLEDGEGSPHLIGANVHAVAGLDVATIESDGRTIGTVYDDGSARTCELGDLRDADVARSRPDQARRVLDDMIAVLARTGMSFRDVVRTWFYNDDILDWYGEFNRVRNTFFTEHGVYDGLVPASTGIGASNPFGAALTAGLIAVRPTDKRVSAAAVPSPLQAPALDYGSSFSRAVELAAPDHRRLFVSGTASIAPDGTSQHVGDVDAQIRRTMEVVGAILSSRGMAWPDVGRGIAYLRRAADVPALERFCTAAGLPSLPLVITCNTVCRDDLLFEIEIEAIVPAGNPA